MPAGQDPDGDASQNWQGSNPPSRNPPLVIVSERGRHSEASRRIVRAQAARASAAQSRETRARNREDRFQREPPQSPADNLSRSTSSSNVAPPRPPSWNQQRHQSQHQPSQSPALPQAQQTPQAQSSGPVSSDIPLAPLVNWITNVLQLSAASLAAGAAALAAAAVPPLESAGDAIARASNAISGGDESERSGGLFSGKQLPLALPKGFAVLQVRVRLSESFLQLLSRTACFDYDSPGVDHRLNQLLFDIVMNTASSHLPDYSTPVHPIQGHLRIACACLTIVQGQRTEGAMFAGNEKYASGLQAAWLEVTTLDQNALREPKSPEAALWAAIMISVTCGSTVDFFARVIRGLLEEMQLRRWEEVRSVLINFIYPGSFLEVPCRHFYQQLLDGRFDG